MLASNLISQCRNYLSEPTAEEWTDQMLLAYINFEEDYLFSELILSWGDFLIEEVFINSVANQERYPLPELLYAFRRVSILLNNIYHPLYPLRSLNSIAEAGLRGWYLYNRSIGVKPAPNLTTNNYFRIDGIKYIPRCLMGDAQGGDANTITLSTNADYRDDYYNNVKIQIVGGTGAGQRRTITDYDGNTKVATVDSNWTIIPDATSIFATESVLPDFMQDVLVLGACKRALVQAKEPFTEVAILYDKQMENVRTLLNKRQLQRPEQVEMYDTEYLLQDVNYYYLV